MAKIERSVITPYSTHRMYDLVADVERYSEFLPGCESVRILERRDDQVQVSVQILFKGVNQSFVTRNNLTPGSRIDMHLLQGPFKRLEGGWRFEPLGSGSKVRLNLEYEFSNKLLALVLGKVIGAFTNTLVNAFVNRARKLYGNA
jgi:ribosome-associated toxin RatA of RatAB toxin-antitoxin module